MKELMRYDAARAALEACVSVDEVKGWADNAAAVAAYARQAKDNELRKMAIDIRERAKRRLGELMAEQKKAGGTNKGGRPRKPGTPVHPVSISLEEAGIDKRLAHEARRAAELSPEDFEAAVETKKAAVDAATSELLERAAEAIAIIASDDSLAASFAEVRNAKREAKTATELYASLKADVAAHQRETAKWKAKAKKSALCEACRVNLERDS